MTKPKNPKTAFYTREDRDRLIWQLLTLAADAILSLQCVQDQLNELLRTFEFAEMKPRKKRKSKPTA